MSDMQKTDFPKLETPAMRALNRAELEAVGGGFALSLDGGLTNREVVEKIYGVKWPIPD